MRQVGVVARFDAGSRRTQFGGEMDRVARQDGRVVEAVQQKHRRSTLIGEGDRLGLRHVRCFQDRLELVGGQRQEIIGAGEADESFQVPALQAGRGEIARVEGHHRGDMRAGRMTHQEQARQIAIVLRRVVARPAHGPRGVLDEGRKAGFGIDAIIRDHDDIAVAGQGLGDETVLRARAAFPAAAIDKDDDRMRAGPLRAVDIQLLARQGAVGDVRRCGVLSRRGQCIEKIEAGTAGRQDGGEKQRERAKDTAQQR